MTNEVYVSNIVKPISWDNVPSDRVNSVTVKFRFSKEWEGLLCVAQFNQDGECKNQVIDENGECKIPVEIGVGYVALTVFGTEENGEAYRATTIPYIFEVYDSKFCSSGETPIPPTPDLYDQLIAKFLQQVTFPPFDDDLSLTSENAVKNRVITESFKIFNDYIAENVLDKNNTDILSEKGKVNITKDGEPIGKGFDLPVVDAELNGESTNAIQNKVVSENINNILKNKVFIYNPSGGFRGGRDGLVNAGAALGDNAETNDGISIGANTFSIDGIAAGKNAIANGTNAISIGADSSAQGNSIQIGSGSNANDNTVQFFTYQMLDENGKIPVERLPVDGELKDSQNPVANSAVFNEFSKLKTLELIADITLEEDTKQVSLTQTQDGNPLNLNRVFVYFIGETTALSTFCLYYNKGSAYQLYRSTGISSGKFSFWVYSEKLNSNLWISMFPEKGISSPFTTDDGLQGLSRANKDLFSDIYFRPDTKIDITSLIFGITANSNSTMKAGSRILIYGENND